MESEFETSLVKVLMNPFDAARVFNGACTGHPEDRDWVSDYLANAVEEILDEVNVVSTKTLRVEGGDDKSYIQIWVEVQYEE